MLELIEEQTKVVFIVLQAVCTGELLYKLYLLVLYWRTPNLISSVFSNENYQLVSVPSILVLSFAFLWLQPVFPILQVCLFSVAWCILRATTSVYASCYIRDLNADIGAGLALNYWESCLQYILPKLDWELSQFEIDLNQQLVRDGLKNGIKDINLRGFKKLVILLPSSCTIGKIRDKRIYKMCDLRPKYYPSESSSIIKFKSRIGQGDVKMNISWIFARETDEINHSIKGGSYGVSETFTNAEKIYFIEDFPALVKSALGPDRGWEEDDREESLTLFQQTLDRLTKNSSSSHNSNTNVNADIVVCRYRDDDGRPVSHHIRQSLLAASPDLKPGSSPNL